MSNQLEMSDLMSSLVPNKKIVTNPLKTQLRVLKMYLKMLILFRIKKFSFYFLNGIALVLIIAVKYIPVDKTETSSGYPYHSIDWQEIGNQSYIRRKFLYDFTDQQLVFTPDNEFTQEFLNIAKNLTYIKDPQIIDDKTKFEDYVNKNKVPSFEFNIDNKNVEIKEKIYESEHDHYPRSMLFDCMRFVVPNISKVQFSVSIASMKSFDDILLTYFIVFIPAILINASILFMCILSIYEMIEIREQKQLLLLKISGANEFTLHFAYFIVDSAMIVLMTILSSIFVYKLGAPNSNYFVYFIFMFFLILSAYFFYLIFVPLMVKSSRLKYIVFIFMVLSIGLPFVPLLFQYAFGVFQKFHAVIVWLPQWQMTYFFMNIVSGLAYKHPMTFSELKNGYILIPSDKLLLIVFAFIFAYLLLFCFFNAMMPRSSGAPPIGFSNIFSLRAWKKALSFDRSMKINVIEGLPFISVNNISKTYKGKVRVHALNDVSFKINEGEVIVLIGPNGSGKSTLLNSMTGSINADSGKLFLYGQNCYTGFSELQSCLGICFQENIFFDRLSVFNNLEFFAKIRGIPDSDLEEEISRCLDCFNLSECVDMRAGTLSGGQKRKLCIAIAFIGKPRFVILDEPTAGIDVTTRQIIWKAISMYNITSLVSSHALEEAEAVSSRLFVMRSGELIFDGTSSELRRKYHCGYRLTPFFNENVTDKDAAMRQLLEWIKVRIHDAIMDDQHQGNILVPVSNDVVKLLEELRENKANFNMKSFNIIVEQLENVLYRMYIDDENE